MAHVEIHCRPVGYSSSDAAVERSMWIGHRIDRCLGQPFYDEIHGREQVVWAVVTACGKKIAVVLEPDWGWAEARDCKACGKARNFTAEALLVEVMPPWRRHEPPKANRRERGISARDAF